MKLKLFVLALFLVTCAPIPIKNGQSDDFTEKSVYRYHDDSANVSCWIWSNGYQGGISCIPDWQLKAP